MTTTAKRHFVQLALFPDPAPSPTPSPVSTESGCQSAGTAPTLFADLSRGTFARRAAFHAWVKQYGTFGCIHRSHGWHPEEYGYTSVEPSGGCRPFLLAADLRCDHHSPDCCCIGDLVHRGACLACTWEGPIRTSENLAAEDAHDHAWPGWRRLPIAPRRPRVSTKAAFGRWVDKVNATYPAGWLEAGGPIRTARQGIGTRHVPNVTGFGGYDLCGLVEP